jgi:hypothetical protein
MVAAWWTAKIASSKTKFGEKNDSDLKQKVKEVRVECQFDDQL